MEFDVKNLGNLIAERHFKASSSFWFRFGGIASLVLTIFAGVYLIFDPVGSDTNTAGLIMLGAAFALVVLMLIASRKIKRSLAIFENGVVVKKGDVSMPYHYSQIAGLYDSSIGGMTVISGGLVGAVVTGVASTIASNTMAEYDKSHRIRGIDIEPTKESKLKRVSVVNTGGDLLSEAYTKWLILSKVITKETINTQELNFGDITLKNGVFTHKRLRGDEVHARLSAVTSLDYEDDHLRFLGTNQTGKQAVFIKINSLYVLNMDLLLYVVNL